METISFVLAFFAMRDLSMLTFFVCWSPGEILELAAGARALGLRSRTFADLRRRPPLPPLPPLCADRGGREGVLLDLACPGARALLQEASESRAFIPRYSWLLLQCEEGAANGSALALEAALAGVAVLADADVTWRAADRLLDVYRLKPGLPLIVSEVGASPRAGAAALRTAWARRPAAPTRRRDLGGIYLKAATIISQPQHFRGWSDVTTRHIDTYPKLTYPLLMLCAEDLNFRFNLKQVDDYGVERNGSFDGLAGRLQRREIEVGVTSMFMRADRWRVLHYCSETVELRGAFIFRQPAQSAVSNVFVLPFSRGVWRASGALLVAGGALLAALTARMRRADPSLRALSAPDCFMFSVGAMCQQGFHMSPALASARMLMLFMLLAALFLFTSYSAKIVAILQTPSDAIQTIADLARSPMALGVQETTYKRVYFAESPDPATQRLYRRKLVPQGERAYLSVVDGIARMRRSLFAFQVEQSSGYDIISKTFTEREKCGLKEIQAFKLPMVAVPIQKHSGFRELFASRLRWQREMGLVARFQRVWLAARPGCAAGGAGGASVALADVLPALHALAAGAALALAALAAELAHCRLTRRRRRSDRADLRS